jgi:hypothetical protein
MEQQSTQIARVPLTHISNVAIVQSGSEAETIVYANSAWYGEQAVVEKDWIEFSALVSAWKRETRLSSSLRNVFASAYYKSITTMDPDKVVPLIIRQLILEGSSPYHWFSALVALTNGNSPPPALGGNVRDISRWWIEWGRARYGRQLGPE